MSGTPCLSVVIPVHQAAPFLPALWAALSRQTLDDIEFIFVDDGSRDDGYAWLQTHTRDDPRVTLLRHEHALGVSAARNSGVDQARGRYLGFCDADDLPGPQHYALLVSLAESQSLDIAIGNGQLFNREIGDLDETIVGLPKPVQAVEGAAWLAHCHAQREWVYAVFLVVLRRDWAAPLAISFPPGMVHEDVVWINRLLLAARRVAHCPAASYHYRQNPLSIMRNPSESARLQRIAGHLAAVRALRDMAESAQAAAAPSLLCQAHVELNKALGLLKELPPAARRQAARTLVDGALLRWFWRTGRRASWRRRIVQTWLRRWLPI
ncbi:glycosyltransferase [Chitinimonas arctica]|uniref:Glycosyltransferase n=1 Tax=Chitinimonas arctica TaxID=2594795 RepID=A0A516SGH5_9NEIS|nr:glycosyltransferase [Chitinimonas arctica]QDQ27269.1 glycosyltransferase [Chitinimonas arctica]